MSSEVLQTMRAGVDEHPQEIMNFFMSFLTLNGGVANVAGDDFSLELLTALTFEIKQGRAIIPKASGLMAYPVWMHTDDAEMAVGSNGSGNPRKDTVVAYIDEGEGTPDTTGTNVAKLVVVAGTPGASPQAPDDSAITSAIGSNPFIRLYNITVPSGASELVSGNIEDVRVQARMLLRDAKLQGFYQDWVDLTPGANVVIDLNKGTKFKITLAQNTTFSVINAKVGQQFQLRVQQAAGGGFTTTFWAGLGWMYDNAPVMTATANKVDKYAFDVVAEEVYDGIIIGQNR